MPRRHPTAFRPCGTTRGTGGGSRRRRLPEPGRDLDEPNQIIFPRPNAGTVPSWRSDPQRVRFRRSPQRRGYRSDAEVETQYRKLFAACDVDENSIVTMGELQKTLFRFGLNKLGTSTLERLFREKALSESPTAVAETAPSSSPDARGEQTLEEFQGAGLDFHQLLILSHAVNSNRLDWNTPGHEPSVVAQVQEERAHVSFSPMEQTKTQCCSSSIMGETCRVTSAAWYGSPSWTL